MSCLLSDGHVYNLSYHSDISLPIPKVRPNYVTTYKVPADDYKMIRQALVLCLIAIVGECLAEVAEPKATFTPRFTTSTPPPKIITAKSQK